MNTEKDKRVGDRLYICNCGRKCCYIMYEDLDAYCEAETKNGHPTDAAAVVAMAMGRRAELAIGHKSS